MTPHPTTSPDTDLSYLRQLAEAGKDTPLMAGPYLVAAGSWFAAASLAQWPVLRTAFDLDVAEAAGLWFVAAAGFAFHLAWLVRRDRGRPENASNRAVNATWQGVGFAIFAFWLGVAALAYRRDDYFLIKTVLLQVLSLYGAAWMLAARMTGRGWMQANAFFAFLTVPVLGVLMGTGQEFLVYAIALVLTAVVPGVWLMREAHARSSSAAGA